jgi:hypothetical protein
MLGYNPKSKIIKLIMYPLTCVSGYWNVNNKHGNKFESWFQYSLKINCPYVFFADKNTIKTIKKYRSNLPTFYIECTIQEFKCYKYKNKMITHPIHCPSVELNLIWNEKIFLIKRALELNPFHSDFFCWVDAGICIYRDILPPTNSFPNLHKLNTLPTNKFIYTSSLPYIENNVNITTYYHHISGTSYILHKNIVNDFAALYEKYLIHTNNIWTDQVILTHIYKDHKQIFYKLGDGYGELFHLIKN